MTGYKTREESLKQLGFNSYAEYLKNGIWYKIRQRLIKKETLCHCCQINKAIQLHHASYEYPVMAGEDDSKLYPVCKFCHRYAEFTKDGKKRTHKQANKIIINRLVPLKEMIEKQNKRKNKIDSRQVKRKIYFSENEINKIKEIQDKLNCGFAQAIKKAIEQF